MCIALDLCQPDIFCFVITDSVFQILAAYCIESREMVESRKLIG